MAGGVEGLYLQVEGRGVNSSGGQAEVFEVAGPVCDGVPWGCDADLCAEGVKGEVDEDKGGAVRGSDYCGRAVGELGNAENVVVVGMGAEDEVGFEMVRVEGEVLVRCEGID